MQPTKNSIDDTIAHVEQGRNNVANAIAALRSAYDLVAAAASNMVDANAHTSDGNSIATAQRLHYMMLQIRGNNGATIAELEGAIENMTDHLSSLNGELEAPESQFYSPLDNASKVC